MTSVQRSYDGGGGGGSTGRGRVPARVARFVLAAAAAGAGDDPAAEGAAAAREAEAGENVGDDEDHLRGGGRAGGQGDPAGQRLEQVRMNFCTEQGRM